MLRGKYTTSIDIEKRAIKGYIHSFRITSLMGLVVSVDVKHDVYLLTYSEPHC